MGPNGSGDPIYSTCSWRRRPLAAKTLAEKLSLKPGIRAVLGAPEGYLDGLGPLPKGAVPGGPMRRGSAECYAPDPDGASGTISTPFCDGSRVITPPS